jgi:hypothetical protein
VANTPFQALCWTAGKMISFIFLLILSFISSISSLGYIEPVDCDEKMTIDHALIQYQHSSNPPPGFIYSLYATNSICYKCSRTLVANDNQQCALLFTPHPYRLYILLENETTSTVLTTRDYTFGEHGSYVVSYDNQEIIIDEEKEPIDSLRPLVDLLSVILVFTFLVFLPSLGNSLPPPSLSHLHSLLIFPFDLMSPLAVVMCSLRLCKEQFHEFKQGTIVEPDSFSAFFMDTFINPGFLNDVRPHVPFSLRQLTPLSLTHRTTHHNNKKNHFLKTHNLLNV